MTLSRSVKQFYGVELSKDETGVTASFATSKLSISVFLDCYTAQIFMKSPLHRSADGLCVDSRNTFRARLPQLSSPSCEVQYTDNPDSTISCSSVTKRCNMLKKAPFTSCNAHVDPTPYINACKETMCKYPTEDGLMTQFLWAYARACSLNGNSNLGDWWTEAECSPPKAFCMDKICSDHEFCGWKFSGEPACLCRALFAYKYKESNTLGEPTVCKHNSASLKLAKCLMEERGINYKDLHLNDQRCRGELDRKSNMVTFNFNTEKLCGAEITSGANEINYTNAIMSQNTSDVIVRHDQVFIEFSCFNSQPELKSVSFRVKDNSYVSHLTSGEWDYTLTMTPYIDEQCSQVAATDTDVKLNQKVWVELRTKGLDAKRIAVVTESCWATSEPNPDSTPRHDLIIDGCANPSDKTVHVKQNGRETSSYFSFNMFEFSRHPDHVYLHCQLQLCIRKSNICVPNCPVPSLRRRRSARTFGHGDPAVISMAWSK
ncbi:pancreatic secretory granule membrane major glycoprotein GP2-like [Nematolebias whitei]|uniref:pancreatic secretory granule membrane major glycoprotein GP2-like n=1 Tax=Nematolebias whitei TaxID=451745 RepID=UPI00189B62E5|nr:pancreatic secretory granule membrane major glycoprotein GP2-like [Nematolebias whitei]